MKTVNQWLKDKLATQSVKLAHIARIRRKDGQLFGFIESDVPVTIEGVEYKPQEGMKQSTTKWSSKGTPNHQTFVGYLSSPDIVEEELEAGLFDDARVDIALIDLDNPPAVFAAGDMIWLGSFFIGEVKLIDGIFQAEIVSLSDKLRTPIVELTSPTCRASFGDARCKFDLSTVRVATTIVSATATQIVVADSIASLNMAYGKITINTGRLKGQTFDVLSAADATTLDLFIPLELQPAVGDSVSVYGGCDKTIAACRGYNNAVNFQGEPNIPGADKWKAGFREVL